MSAWTQCNPKDLEGNVFSFFDDEWVLIAAEKEGTTNAMTASWGSLGVLWSRMIATIYVHKSRYTSAFLDAADTFSITAFDKSYRPMLNDVMGSKSGRDVDKIKLSGLTLSRLNDTPVFDEANLAIVCKKLYRHPFSRDGYTNQEVYDEYHTEHILYVAQIEAVYGK